MKVYDAGLKSGDGLYLFKTYCSLLGRPLYAESNSKHISLALCQTNVRLSVCLSCHRPELRQKYKSHSEITDISKSLTSCSGEFNITVNNQFYLQRLLIFRLTPQCGCMGQLLEPETYFGFRVRVPEPDPESTRKFDKLPGPDPKRKTGPETSLLQAYTHHCTKNSASNLAVL